MKKCLIIGNVNAITYKEVFPLIRDNQLWLGVSISSGDIEFETPDYYPMNAFKCRIDDKGKKYLRIKNIRWFTNITNVKYNKQVLFKSKYDPLQYPKYDNYDAIEVSKTKDIPYDYDGVIGVPITFIDKYNPNQFEIIDLVRPKLNKQNVFIRLFIRRKK